MVASRQRDQGQVHVLGLTMSCDVVSLLTAGFLIEVQFMAGVFIFIM